MKRKKLLFGSILNLIIFISCAKSSNNDTLIVGKWYQVSGTPTSNFAPCDFQGSYIDLKSNDTYTEYSKCSNKLSDGIFKKSGNTIIVTANALPIPVTFNIVSLSSTELILENTFLGSPERVTYKH